VHILSEATLLFAIAPLRWWRSIFVVALGCQWEPRYPAIVFGGVQQLLPTIGNEVLLPMQLAAHYGQGRGEWC
jgi:hypothetical protein